MLYRNAVLIKEIVIHVALQEYDHELQICWDVTLIKKIQQCVPP
jgi:hypothetical protein